VDFPVAPLALCAAVVNPFTGGAHEVGESSTGGALAVPARRSRPATAHGRMTLRARSASASTSNGGLACWIEDNGAPLMTSR